MKKFLLFCLLALVIKAEAQHFYQVGKITGSSTNLDVTSRWIGMNLSLKNNVIVAGSSGQLEYPWSNGQPIKTPSWILNANSTGSSAQIYKAQRLSDVSFDNPADYNTNFGKSSATNGTVTVLGEPKYFEGIGNTAEAMGSATVFELVSGVWQPKQRLLASDKANNTSFGESVAVGDSHIFVGIKVYNQYANVPGAVYVFGKDNNGDWVQTQKIEAPLTESIYVNYSFGHSVAVSGDYLLVATAINAQVAAAGTLAHIYKKDGSGNWQYHQKLVVPPTYNFAAHTITINGNYIAMGGDIQSGSNEAAFIFEKDGNEVWSFVQSLLDPDALRTTFFGRSISISGDLLAVGSPTNSTNEIEADLQAGAGAVYLYKRGQNGVWAQQQKIVGNDRFGGSGFGHAVALDGNTLVASSSLYFKSVTGAFQSGTYYEGEIYLFKNLQASSLPNTADVSFTPGRVASMLFATPNEQPILSIGLTGALPLRNNATNAKVWKQAAEQSLAGKLYLARNYQITPTNNISTSTATVTLYFNQQEFLDFNANPAKTADFPINASDLSGIANLRILKISGSSSDNSGLINTYSGTQLVINPDDDKIVWNATANRWEVTFNVTGFSGFFATTEPTVLPVNLVDFKVSKESSAAKLQWQTATETNNKGFEIYRSGDDKQFLKIGQVAAKGSNSVYTFNDKQPLNGSNYYKLIQVDNDGTQHDMGVKTLSFALNVSDVKIYPNPTIGKATLSFTAGKYQNVSIIAVDGKVLNYLSVLPNQTEVKLNLSAYASGVYFVKMIGINGVETQKIIKK